jgi:hypothetical protein
MIWINTEQWSSGAGRWFTYRRIYIKGYKWTPFIICIPRFLTKISNPIYPPQE